MKCQFIRAVGLLAALLVFANFSPASAQKLQCNALQAYRKEASELWQAASRLETALLNRNRDKREDSCNEVRELERRVTAHVEKEAKVHWDCVQNEGINVVGSDKVDAQSYLARMLTRYCGVATSDQERGMDSSNWTSGWSYHGKIILPIGLMVALAALVITVARRM